MLSVINDVRSKVGPEVAAYRLKTDIAPYTTLGAEQFERIEMPERWLSENAVTDLDDLRGKIAVTTLRKGSLLQTDMIVDRPALQPGQQEVAIMIDAATGVAGKITPGSTVNVYATFEGQREGDPDQSKIIVTGAKVLDVGFYHGPPARRGRPPWAHRRRPHHLRAVHPRRPAHHLRRVVRPAGAARAGRPRGRRGRPREGPDVRTRAGQVRGPHVHQDPPGSR